LSNRPIPFATLALILLTLGAASLTLSSPDSLLRWGYVPEPLAAPSVLQRLVSAFTSLFVHLDPLHLLGNMLFLAAVGPAVERAAGWWKLLLVFVVAGLVGVAGHHLAATTAMEGIAAEPLAGSSAGIAGLIGYAWLRFRRAKVPLLPNVWAPVWLVILFWILLQAAGAWFSAAQFGAPVAYFAHVFGFVAGFLLAFPLGAAEAAADEAWQDHLAEAGQRGHAAKAQVLQNRSDAESLATLADSHEAAGERDAAASAYLKLLEADPAFDGAIAVTKLERFGKLSIVSRSERLRIGSAIAGEHPSAAAILFDSVAGEPADSLTPAALEALVNATGDQAAKRRLLSEYSLSPEAERVRAQG
jgi:membrane associated rhomboid family serine protease